MIGGHQVTVQNSAEHSWAYFLGEDLPTARLEMVNIYDPHRGHQRPRRALP